MATQWIANKLHNRYVGFVFILCVLTVVFIFAQHNMESWQIFSKPSEIGSVLGVTSSEDGGSTSASSSQNNFGEKVHDFDKTTSQSQACIHPKLDVKDKYMMKFYHRVPKTVCKVEKNWVYVQNGTLHFDPEVLKRHKHNNVSCDYLPIRRKGDFKIEFADAVKNIPNPFTIKDDHFKVVCTARSASDGKQYRYENIHQGVAYRQEYVDRKHDPMKEGFEGMSIALLGFDSMSRMSWLRRLPVTRKYFVEELGAIELEQHNIVGDGTTAVMFPMFTGKFEWELPECRVNFKGAKPMDDFPWIWRDFKKAGYLTSWSNANPKDATFNWRMLGFEHQPTDFYPRPYYLGIFPTLKKYPTHCVGSQSRQDIWLKWFTDVFHMYKNQRKFLIHFYSDMSHTNNNLLTAMDEPIKQRIQHLHDGGYLNNTLLILMADHGARYDYFRYTIPGKLEERLPYFSFLFPRWFVEKYPEAIKNLKTNANRLTTPFDLHETFKDFFKYSGSGKGDVSNRGISLFKEVPLERTCQHAGIAPHWCGCLTWKKIRGVDEDVYAKNALKTALDTINGYTADYRSDCALLTVGNVTMVTKMEHGKEFLNFKKTDANGGIYDIDFSAKNKNEKALYQLTFTTTPGAGQFEATVSYDYKSKRYSLSEKEISRINKYGNAPHCILGKNRQIRQYCYCKDLLVGT